MLTERLFLVAQNGAEAILWLLMVLSILSVSIMIERWLTLGRLRRAGLKFRERLREALDRDRLEEIEELKNEREALEGCALNCALRHYHDFGEKGIEQVFNAYVIMEKPRLERGLNFLATVGSNAPFIGLLGTVLGIMKAFQDLGMTQQQSGVGNTSLVMNGIAEALVATAVGLFVAIPAVVAFNHFQKQVRGLLSHLDGVREICVAYAQQQSKRKPKL